VDQKIKSPFKIFCESGWDQPKTFTFSNMMDTDRTYYYLNGDIGNIRVNRYDGTSEYGYTSRFEEIGNTEKFYLEKINVIPIFENHGIMTIIFCDMMLCIFNREMAYRNNIELKLVNLADKDKNKKIINVYQSVLPGYELSEILPKNNRIVLEKLHYNKVLDCSYYDDIYYLFPLNTRKSDIEYYQNLRSKKIKNLDTNKIKYLQTLRH